jgi:hypothetical protein
LNISCEANEMFPAIHACYLSFGNLQIYETSSLVL